MGIVEKRAPVALSYAAMGAGIVVTGWLWLSGASSPEAFTGSMYYNHHNEYGGKSASCNQCHIAESRLSLGSAITCLRGCHVPFEPDHTQEQAVELLLPKFVEKGLPDAQQRSEHIIALHNAADAQSCWDCHTEHTKHHRIALPEGWVTFQQKLEQERAARPSASMMSFRERLITGS